MTELLDKCICVLKRKNKCAHNASIENCSNRGRSLSIRWFSLIYLKAELSLKKKSNGNIENVGDVDIQEIYRYKNFS